MSKRSKPAAAGRVVSLALLALLTLGALLALDRLYRAEMFRIASVEIHGIHGGGTRVDGEQVRAVVERALPATYFSVELAAIESRIEQLPWVFNASLRRKWPDALVVDVTEIQPVAKWGGDKWLHSNGALVARPAGVTEAEAGAEWRDLPALSGPGARAESRAEVWRAYQTWSKAFAAKGLHLDELHVDARGLCYLQLSVSALAARDGHESPPIRLVVPADVADARIARFTRALREPQLGDLAALRAVDLRYPNGFAVSRALAVAAATAPESPTVAEAR